MLYRLLVFFFLKSSLLQDFLASDALCNMNNYTESPDCLTIWRSYEDAKNFFKTIDIIVIVLLFALLFLFDIIRYHMIKNNNKKLYVLDIVERVVWIIIIALLVIIFFCLI